MKNIPLKPLLFLLIATAHQAFSADPEAVQDSLIRRGIDLTIEARYDEAQHCFAELIELYPDDAAGYFFMAAHLQAKMMDFETDVWQDDFYHYIQNAITTATAKLKHHMQDARTQFYLGGAYAYKAFYLARNGRYLQGLKYGKLCLDQLQVTIAVDSSWYDAYLGIGSFKYWRSKFTRYFRWFPLLDDERDEGIRLIRLAIERGRYSKWTAVNDLTWILIDDRQVDEALELAIEGASRFTESRFFLWPLAECYFLKGNFSEAIEVYQRILASLSAIEPNNHYNEIACHLKIAEAYHALHRFQDAKRHCTVVLEYQLDRAIRKRASEKIRRATKLAMECDKQRRD